MLWPACGNLSAFSDHDAYSAWVKTQYEKNDWKWQVENSYILICSFSPVQKIWELHSVVARDWAEYVQDLRNKWQEWRYWSEQRRKERRILSDKVWEARVAMRLGDISPEEYEEAFEEYRKAL
ncbi:MAG TPA: hypothetical protein P5169_03665 [Kiritimatiellia bacterium]|nr:hypothetical protein [Kiritimatiellia bacterium]